MEVGRSSGVSPGMTFVPLAVPRSVEALPVEDLPALFDRNIDRLALQNRFASSGSASAKSEGITVEQVVTNCDVIAGVRMISRSPMRTSRSLALAPLRRSRTGRRGEFMAGQFDTRRLRGSRARGRGRRRDRGRRDVAGRWFDDGEPDRVPIEQRRSDGHGAQGEQGEEGRHRDEAERRPRRPVRRASVASRSRAERSAVTGKMGRASIASASRRSLSILLRQCEQPARWRSSSSRSWGDS